MTRKGFWVCSLALLAVRPAAAQQVTLKGQIRPRYEFRDPAPDGRADEFISMRLRAGFDAVLANDISLTVQFQDVRLWGEETSPLGDFRADNLDLHQGFLTIGRVGGSNVWARFGRQESPFGNERLIGSVDWTQQGQSFDGVRIGTTESWGTGNFIGFKITEETAGAADDLWLFGGHASISMASSGLDVFAFYERTRGTARGNQGTLGARWTATPSAVDVSVEGAYQLGTRAGADVSAFMVGASAGVKLTDQLKATLWYDYLSGDADPADDEQGVFSTLYATNHKYYGYADLFTNIPAHTAGRGLQDMALKVTFAPSERLGIDADLHEFLLAEKRALPESRLGEELDVTLRWTVRPGLGFTGGFSEVFHADGLTAINRLTENMSFGYAMLNVAF